MVELIDEDQGPPGETYRPAPMWPSDRPRPKGGTWAGSLAAPEGADQVRLRVAVGDASRTVLCHRAAWPEPDEPPAKLLTMPPAKRGRRTRRAASELRS